MKSFLSGIFFIWCALITVSSCTKGDSGTDNSIQDSVLSNGLEVAVVKRESKWAIVSWTNLQRLAPSESVKYKIYINGTLLKSGLTGTMDTIRDISFDTTYAGYIYAYTSTKLLDGNQFNLDRLQFEKERLVGLWNPTLPYRYAYKQRYFGADSSYFQDVSNFNLGISSGKWWWSTEDSVQMLITTGYFASPTPVPIRILDLTTDSLKIRWGTDTQTYYK